MADDFDLPDADDIGDMDTDNDFDASSPAPAKEGEVQELVKGGGVQKVLVKAGQGWEAPEKGDEVKGTFIVEFWPSWSHYYRLNPALSLQ